MVTAQRTFLEEHPLRWIPLWQELMMTHARTDFYQGVAMIAGGALRFLANEFKLSIPEQANPL